MCRRRRSKGEVVFVTWCSPGARGIEIKIVRLCCRFFPWAATRGRWSIVSRKNGARPVCPPSVPWGRGYLQQYLNEFDFRYNHRKVNDSERTILALKAIEGKRLT